MTHAILVLTDIALCLAAAFLVSWDLAPMFLKPRAALPAIDPGMLAHMRRKLAEQQHSSRTLTVDRPPLYDRGANLYPAETLTDMPVIPLVRPYTDDGTRWIP
jgi:hypothetical protein